MWGIPLKWWPENSSSILDHQVFTVPFFFFTSFYIKKKPLNVFNHSLWQQCSIFVSVEKISENRKAKCIVFCCWYYYYHYHEHLFLFLYISYTKLRNNYYQYFRMILYWFLKKMAQIWSANFQFCSSFNT